MYQGLKVLYFNCLNKGNGYLETLYYVPEERNSISGDSRFAEVLYTTGWVYRDNRWQYIHWQGTLTGMSLQGKGMIEPPKN